MAKGFAQDKQWNWHNFWICLGVGFVGQLAFGYPSSIIGVTLAQPAFLEYMGLLTVVDGVPGLSSNANSLIGATSGVFQVRTRGWGRRTQKLTFLGKWKGRSILRRPNWELGDG
jgi:hypothetical protein